MLLERGRYYYKVFGLYVASDILLPELLIATDMPDIPEVSISLGKVPSRITNPIEKTVRYEVTKNELIFRVPGVGVYYVTQGRYIVVEPVQRAEELLVRIFLLGTIFGALLMQRGILPIHGSAVLINECGVIFTGVSGAGKSTLLAAFREQGYSFLTDDVAAVTLDENGIPWVNSSYPQQKLWKDSAKNAGVDIDSLTPFYIGIDKDKFAVPICKGFGQSPAPLVAIYELEEKKCQAVSLNNLTSMDKLALLISHTYRPWLIEGLGLKTAHFKHCAAVARQIAASSLTRPAAVFSTEEQIRLIQQDLARLLANRAI